MLHRGATNMEQNSTWTRAAISVTQTDGHHFNKERSPPVCRRIPLLADDRGLFTRDLLGTGGFGRRWQRWRR